MDFHFFDWGILADIFIHFELSLTNIGLDGFILSEEFGTIAYVVLDSWKTLALREHVRYNYNDYCILFSYIHATKHILW